MTLITIVILIVFLFWFIHFLRFRKVLNNIGHAHLFTGGLKTGKTFLSVLFVYKLYRRELIKYYFKRFLNLFRKKENKKYLEKPLIYSNMPIGRIGKDKYVPLTLDLIEQKTRFRYNSIVYFNEMSLIAGSKDIYNEELNDALNKLIKLFAHETHNGFLIVDTQSPMDSHYVLKRSLATYFHIYERKNYFFKMFSCTKLRQKELIDGDHSQNIDNYDPKDADFEGVKHLYEIWAFNRKWWKRYDRWAYSYFTDDLPVEDRAIIVEDQKVKKLIRIRDIAKKNNSK